MTNDAKTGAPAKSGGTNAMWGGRFRAGPAEAMTRFNACLEDDKRLALEDIAGSIAHARMLARQDMLSGDEADQIVDGLARVREEIVSESFVWSEALEDVHMNVESRLRELIGDVAGKLHTGRSRNDQVATDMRLWTRAALDRISGALRDAQAAFLSQAEGHEESVMPGFTHLQIAQPISYAQWCLAYVEMLGRDGGRIADARARLNESPLGAAALAGTPHPIDRPSTAEALHFERPMRNSLDAVSARDFALEAVGAASICAGHLSRLAEELVIFATPQFGYLRMSDEYSTGSSIMPQKRNPDAAELLRSKVGAIGGALVALTMQTKGLPLAYSKDLQETKRPLMDALDSLEECLEITAGMIRTMTPNPEAMARDAGEGFATATDVADMLAARGMPFRDAHHVVGALVAACEERGCKLHELPLNDAQGISPAITQDMLDSLTPLESLKRRTSEGGTSPGSVRGQIEYWRGALSG
ncbi:argininosuccinate lyase [Parvularcula oceani]|uniref:argininosuccinate lyase n=1 Tax=Parvularcula oceani TaxID=1247963 RepID=UPI0004E27AD4|nr:argininosuccinate lyase [Parvularcula oceani]